VRASQTDTLKVFDFSHDLKSHFEHQYNHLSKGVHHRSEARARLDFALTPSRRSPGTELATYHFACTGWKLRKSSGEPAGFPCELALIERLDKKLTPTAASAPPSFQT
jgi:hypothetical protein